MIFAAFYRLAIAFYAAALHIAALFNPKAKLFINGRKGWRASVKDKLASDGRPRIWMHCASLGEFEQGRPVLETLRKKYPSHSLVLTFFSPSGYEVRKDYKGADHVFYLPFDTPRNAAYFLDIVKPQLCLFVKYELWYYFLKGIAKRQIPLLLISAIFRKDQLFFKWYGGLYRNMLRRFTHLFVQDETSEELLQTIDSTHVTVSGDTRFDRVIEATQIITAQPLATAFAEGHKVLVAGSTWKEDEVFLNSVLKKLPEGWRIILVPHEVDEAHIADITKLFAGNSTLWSQPQVTESTKVLIVDEVGLLLQLYSYGRYAWIGGGFGKDGIHNVLEAAVYSIPCAYGPVYHQFLEAEQMVACGGAVIATTPEQYAAQLLLWQSNKDSYNQAALAAGRYVRSHGGATEKITAYIDESVLLSAV
ncbi:MAG: 3-deoxy-D-manno-octulosonic acid transferase [Taibaiella sp.]|nr:3-deoxy-D-manno-octulosonic acid transferase [Taibaiella sp.]